MTSEELAEIEARAEASPHYRDSAIIRIDIPALIAAVRERDAVIAELRSRLEILECSALDSCYECDERRAALAKLDGKEGA